MKWDMGFIAQLREGEEGAFTRLYEETGTLLYNYILGRVRGNVQAADDVLSEVFCDAISHAVSLTPLHNVQAWLFRIAKSKIANHFRLLEKEGRLKSSSDPDTVANGKGHGRDPEIQFIAGEESLAVKAAFATLSDAHREVLERMYIRGQSMKEIAASTVRSEKSVESLLYRARKDFERAIVRIGEGPRSMSVKGSVSTSKSSTVEPGGLQAGFTDSRKKVGHDD